jgi:hypothetical protein
MKLTWLSVHIMQFAQQHGEVGIFTEQAIEAYHVLHAQVSRHYGGVNDAERRRKLIFRRLVLIAIYGQEEMAESNYEMDIEDE